MPGFFQTQSAFLANRILPRQSPSGAGGLGSELMVQRADPTQRRWLSRSSSPRQRPTRDPGSSLSTSYAVGTLDGRQLFGDSLSRRDRADCYEFTLSHDSVVQLGLTHLSANANLHLFDQQGDRIAFSGHRGRSAESITETLAAGTYYARINGVAPQQVRYRLQLQSTTVTIADDPSLPINPDPDAWTVMVYMAADNLEYFAIEDFLEMAAVGSSDDVNIVVQLDRTSISDLGGPWGDDTRFGNWTDTRRGLVQAGSRPNQLWGTSMGEVNMGSATTLSNFVNWSMNTYQADNYALVLWGHGSGFNVSYDDATGDSISARELNTVLGGLGDTIDLVGTDACLMGMVEFAYQIRNQASVFVGSQELEPGAGWDYQSILNDLVTTPTLTAAEWGAVLVDRYGESYSAIGNNGISETLSAIDLTALRSTDATSLVGTLNTFASTVMTMATHSDRGQIELHRDYRAQAFGDTDWSYYNYCDIGNLFADIATNNAISTAVRTAAQAVLDAYSNVVIHSYAAIANYSTGLSIYFANNGHVSSGYTVDALSFAGDTLWDDMLGTMGWPRLG